MDPSSQATVALPHEVRKYGGTGEKPGHQRIEWTGEVKYGLHLLVFTQDYDGTTLRPDKKRRYRITLRSDFKSVEVMKHGGKVLGLILMISKDEISVLTPDGNVTIAKIEGPNGSESYECNFGDNLRVVKWERKSEGNWILSDKKYGWLARVCTRLDPRNMGAFVYYMPELAFGTEIEDLEENINILAIIATFYLPCTPTHPTLPEVRQLEKKQFQIQEVARLQQAEAAEYPLTWDTWGLNPERGDQSEDQTSMATSASGFLSPTTTNRTLDELSVVNLTGGMSLEGGSTGH